MNDDIVVDLDLILGHIRIIQTTERRGTKILMGSYAIHYDRHGMETHRTENKWTTAVECYSNKIADQMSRAVLTVNEGRNG